MNFKKNYKKNLKRFASIILAGAFVAGLAACGNAASNDTSNEETSADGSDKLQVVTTIFPEYDWVREVVGQGENSVNTSVADKVEVTMLMDNGVDLHSYQPTAADIAKISTCDVFIYVGGESDEWVDDALKEAKNKDIAVIDLMDVLGDNVKEEELVEGMEGEEEDEASESEASKDEISEDEAIETDENKESEDSAIVENVGNSGSPNAPAPVVKNEGSENPGFSDEGSIELTDEEAEAEDAEESEEETEAGAEEAEPEHEESDHEDGEGHHHDDGEIEYDEHVWLSLKNAETLTEKIADVLGTKDVENAAVYKENAAAYVEKLSALDTEYQSAVDASTVDTILFGDRFPFRYLVDDYGINYYAAFIGCSAETEASFETIIFLSGKIDELGLPAICTIEKGDQEIAETVKNNTESKDQEILTLNSLQAVTSAEVEAGASYLKIMTDNLSVLKKALGVAE